MHAIEELASFVTARPEGWLPATTRRMAALLVTDLIAAAAAGKASPLAQAALAAARDLYGPGPAQVWMSPHRLSIAGAAMANAASASALDIDDGHRGAGGHPGAAVIPAALAVGQALDAPGERIFEAITLGYDVALRIATARPTGSFPTYSSGRWGCYGAAVAAGHLLRLDAGQMAHALGIAGAEGPVSYPTGSSAYQGSTVKEVIPPAVVAGLTAAFRARAGATGILDLLDDPALYRRGVLTGDPGRHWWIGDCYLKPYACCRYMHAPIDAIAALRDPGRPVLSLRIETFPKGLQLSNERAPHSLEAGQYSYYFSCALAAVHGIAALQPVDPAMLGDPQVLDLAARIELVAHPDFADVFPMHTPGRVILDQGGGPQEMTVRHPLGDVANPMSQVQVVGKFCRISARTLTDAARDRILTALDGLTDTGFAPLYAALDLETL